MEPTTILVLMIVFALFIIAVWLIKKVFKAVFLAGLILLVLALVFGLYVYSDFLDVRDNIVTQDSLFIFSSSEIHAGFSAKFTDQYSKSYEPEILSEENITYYNPFFGKGKLDQIKDDYYKIFIIREPAFEDIETIQVQDTNYTKEFILNTLYHDNPQEIFASKLATEQNVPIELVKEQLPKDAGQLKATLFIRLFATKLEKEGPLFLIREFKKGNIEIYPETAIVKVAKIFPLKYTDKFIEKIEV